MLTETFHVTDDIYTDDQCGVSVSVFSGVRGVLVNLQPKVRSGHYRSTAFLSRK